jgi:hypothetical protein
MVATLATACGSSGSSAEVERETTTTEAATTSSTAAQGPTASELTAMLLTADEMGEGWTVTTSDPDDDDQISCVADLEEDGTLDSTKAEVQFDYGNGLAFVLEGTRWAGEDPQTTYEALVDAIDDCDSAALSGSEIQSIVPISYPTVADDVSAWEVTFTADGQTITAQMIVALQDDILIQVMGAYPTQVMTADESQPVVEGAAQKVARFS